MACLSRRQHNARMLRFPYVLTCLLVVVLLPGLPAVARAYIDIVPATGSVTINWSGGDISRDIDFCVVSVNGASQAGTSVLPYDLRVTSSSGAMSMTGPGADLPVGMDWTDLETGSSQALGHGVVTARTLSGAVDACPAGDNARATFTVSAADLYARPPGTYAATFSFRVRNQAAGARRDVVQVAFNVVVPTVVHLSGLDSLSLGTWNRTGDMAGSDALCVFINSGVLYSVTAAGSGSGGAFAVSNGSEAIPFAAMWDDGSGASALAAGTALANRANANTSSIDCTAGGNNATFSITVAEGDLRAATGTGTYSGSVTVTVQAQ